jgi:hypothetical protein
MRDAARSETPASDRSLRLFVATSAAAAFSADRDDELDELDDDDDALEDELDMSPMVCLRACDHAVSDIGDVLRRFKRRLVKRRLHFALALALYLGIVPDDETMLLKALDTAAQDDRSSCDASVDGADQLCVVFLTHDAAHETVLGVVVELGDDALGQIN